MLRETNDVFHNCYHLGLIKDTKERIELMFFEDTADIKCANWETLICDIYLLYYLIIRVS